MPDWTFPTTEALQAEIVAEADEQTLILTSGFGISSRSGRGGFPHWPDNIPLACLPGLLLFSSRAQKRHLPFIFNRLKYIHNY